MESTLSAYSTVTATNMARTNGVPSLSLITISKACHFSGGKHLHPLLFARCSPRSSSVTFRSISSSGGGSGFGGYNGGSGGGGGGGGWDSGDSKTKLGAAASDGVSVPSSDIIILDVRGMTCGGCSASVKKILESQPQVASASVNLTTETAIIWPVPEAKIIPDWQKSLGETLANHLTNCGFQSTPRGEVPEDIAGEFAS